MPLRAVPKTPMAQLMPGGTGSMASLTSWKALGQDVNALLVTLASFSSCFFSLPLVYSLRRLAHEVIGSTRQ